MDPVMAFDTLYRIEDRDPDACQFLENQQWIDSSWLFIEVQVRHGARIGLLDDGGFFPGRVLASGADCPVLAVLASSQANKATLAVAVSCAPQGAARPLQVCPLQLCLHQRRP